MCEGADWAINLCLLSYLCQTVQLKVIQNLSSNNNLILKSIIVPSPIYKKHTFNYVTIRTSNWNDFTTQTQEALNCFSVATQRSLYVAIEKFNEAFLAAGKRNITSLLSGNMFPCRRGSSSCWCNSENTCRAAQLLRTSSIAGSAMKLSHAGLKSWGWLTCSYFPGTVVYQIRLWSQYIMPLAGYVTAVLITLPG